MASNRQLIYTKAKIAETYWRSKGSGALYGKGHSIDTYFWYKLLWYLADYLVIDGYSDDDMTVLASSDKTDYDVEMIIFDALKEYDVMAEEESFNDDLWEDDWKIGKLGAQLNEEVLASIREDGQLASITLGILEDMDEKIPSLTCLDSNTEKDILHFVNSDGKRFTIRVTAEE